MPLLQGFLIVYYRNAPFGSEFGKSRRLSSGSGMGKGNLIGQGGSQLIALFRQRSGRAALGGLKGRQQ
jgi:hypothetical protein